MLLLIQTRWRRKHCFVPPAIQGWEHMGMFVGGVISRRFPSLDCVCQFLSPTFELIRVDNSLWRAYELRGRARTGREMEPQ